MREIDTELNELICAGQDISEHWPLKMRESVKMLEKKVRCLSIDALFV
jgi:hypothetical protein